MKANQIVTYHANHGEQDDEKNFVEEVNSPMIVTAVKVDDKTGIESVSGYIFPVDGSGPEFVEDIPPAGGKLHKAGAPGYTL